MNKVSVLIPCFNSEQYIQATLESVRWADEIVIVDSFSTDKTLDICRGYTDKIYQNPFVHAAAQKNWALDKCTYDWVLQMDSDEEAEPGMESEIRGILNIQKEKFVCYKLPRRNFIYGTWLKTCGYYPDYQARLFKKSVCRFEDRAVHERLLTPDKRCGFLQHHIIHHDFKNLTTHIHKINRYGGYHAIELTKQNYQLHAWDLFLRPCLVFIHRYFLLKGICQGYPGFLQSCLVAFEVFLKYAKYWEQQWNKNSK